MMVKCLCSILSGLVLVFIVSLPPVAAAEGDAGSKPRLIGVIPIGKLGISPALYRHVDRLAPELKKLSPGKAVRIECRYNGVSSREKDVHRALMVAAEATRYLYEIHKVRLNFWLTARFGAASAEDPAGLTFTLLSDDIAILGREPVAPAKADVE